MERLNTDYVEIALAQLFYTQCEVTCSEIKEVFEKIRVYEEIVDRDKKTERGHPTNKTINYYVKNLNKWKHVLELLKEKYPEEVMDAHFNSNLSIGI